VSLAVDTYDNTRTMPDGEGILNLAWTVDERDFLRVDLTALVTRELEEEARGRLPFLNRYFVDDPYGQQTIGPAVASFFSLKGEAGVTCGAGVNSLLHALALLVGGGTACLIGDGYPDFSHWVQRLGGECVSRSGLDVRGTGAAVVLIERPELIGSTMPLDAVRELCEEAAPLGAIVVADESYANYYPPSFSAATLTASVPNLAVLRGLAKANGQGGLRFGYCITSPQITQRVRGVVAPMLASSLSMRIARAILGLGDICEPLRARIRSARREMLELLQSSAVIDVLPSCEAVPYVFCRAGDPGVPALEKRGIVGKLHAFRMERTGAIEHRYRLSVPLAAERFELFRAKLNEEPR